MNGELAGRNADILAQALSLSRGALGELGSEDERQRRLDAIAHIEGYMELLREPTAGYMFSEPVLYSFKLVFPDGRWAIDEKQLAGRPHAGDIVEFENFGGWRIESEQRVGVKPAGKAPREFFVCAPAA